MTDAERREAELFRSGAKKPLNESKEDEMSNTKNAVKTAVNNESKEDTMTIKGIPFTTTKTGRTYYDRNADLARHTAIRDELFDALEDFGTVEVVTCIPGETWQNFTNDVNEVNVLGHVMAMFGWTSVCTVAKAGKYHGTPNPDYEGHGWLVRYLPRTPKTGKNAGIPHITETVVYPEEAFIWDTESGKPEFDEQKAAEVTARKAKTAANRAKKALRDANKAAGIKTPRKKAAKKPAPKAEVIKDEPVAAAAPSADVAAMAETVNALMAQNAQLIAALTAALSK